MAEHHLNDRIIGALAGFDPVRVENAVGPGTPDINHRSGWIESKHVPAWPKRAATVLAVDHYTPQQRGWHMRRSHRGGMIHVAIEVAGEFFLFDAGNAAQHLGVDWTRSAMLRETLLHLHPFKGSELRAFFEVLGA